MALSRFVCFGVKQKHLWGAGKSTHEVQRYPIGGEISPGRVGLGNSNEGPRDRLRARILVLLEHGLEGR